MSGNLHKKIKAELNRRANFAVRNGNISNIKKYHVEITEFENTFPKAGKVMNSNDWEHIDFLYKKMCEGRGKKTT
jgi:hypothetical protein